MEDAHKGKRVCHGGDDSAGRPRAGMYGAIPFKGVPWQKHPGAKADRGDGASPKSNAGLKSAGYATKP